MIISLFQHRDSILTLLWTGLPWQLQGSDLSEYIHQCGRAAHTSTPFSCAMTIPDLALICIKPLSFPDLFQHAPSTTMNLSQCHLQILTNSMTSVPCPFRPPPHWREWLALFMLQMCRFPTSFVSHYPFLSSNANKTSFLHMCHGVCPQGDQPGHIPYLVIAKTLEQAWHPNFDRSCNMDVAAPIPQRPCFTPRAGWLNLIQLHWYAPMEPSTASPRVSTRPGLGHLGRHPPASSNLWLYFLRHQYQCPHKLTAECHTVW